MKNRLTVIITMADGFPVNDLHSALTEQLALAGSELGNSDDDVQYNIISETLVTQNPDALEPQRTVDDVCDSEVWYRPEIVEYMRRMGWHDLSGGGVGHDAVTRRFDTYYHALLACIQQVSEE
jgi:hypothetical protein